ncbi:transcription antitermination factor NusB [Ferroacidibacillus organovorans]|uniref:Transcription antitermination protein NusB n=1 Tax=Ferroacidibacillus organovorans TaxID=1765683 RepID=A0A1V4EUZ1_9BACL|nr:transcription antitermination factor NusB [Ferroacidibacillus organovorans]OPG16468.1 transcription antitermination factor NusB [Ferroacidibacillus organovorans]
MSRHGSRQLALQALYHLDLNRVEWEQAVAMTRAMIESIDYDETYLAQLMNGITDHQEMIDKILDRYSQDWDVDRMPGVDRNILRIGAFELLYGQDIPPAVAMNEAVELSKTYGTERSARFVNGVLAGVLRDLSDLHGETQVNGQTP